MSTIKHFRFFIVVITAPIFLPLFINPYFTKYTYVLLFTGIIFLLIIKRGTTSSDNGLQLIKWTNYYFIGIIFLKVLIYGYSYQILPLFIPFMLSTVVLRYSSSFPEERSEEFIAKSLSAVYYVFVIQFILSLFESLSGSYLIPEYSIGNPSSSMV